MIAAVNGHVEAVKLLLAQEGVNPDKAVQANGATALMLASKNGHVEVVKLLLAEDNKLKLEAHLGFQML